MNDVARPRSTLSKSYFTRHHKPWTSRFRRHYIPIKHFQSISITYILRDKPRLGFDGLWRNTRTPPLPRDRDRDRDRAEPKAGIARSHTGAPSQENSGLYVIAANQERSSASYMASYAQEKLTPLPSPSLHPVGSSKASAYSSAHRQDAIDPEKEKERQDAAADISRQLKHLYLRTQKPENAARCLSVGGLGMQLPVFGLFQSPVTNRLFRQGIVV